MAIRPGAFLCGCDPSTKSRYSGDTAKSVIPGADPVYTDKRFDEEGYEVCPEHGERKYGWRSDDPKQPHYIGQGQGNPPKFVSPCMKSVNVEFSGEDQRDNRDPELVTAERKAMANGHA